MHARVRSTLVKLSKEVKQPVLRVACGATMNGLHQARLQLVTLPAVLQSNPAVIGTTQHTQRTYMRLR